MISKENQICSQQRQAQEFVMYTWGYQIYLLLSLRLLRPFFDDVFLEHGGLPHSTSF